MKRFLISAFLSLQLTLLHIHLPHAQGKDPSVAISTNKTSFSRGDTLQLSGRLRAGTDTARKLRIFLSFQLPDEKQLFTTDLKTFATTPKEIALTPISNVSAKDLKDFFSLPLPREARLATETLSPGTYRVIAELLDETKNEIIDASTLTFTLTDNPSVQVSVNKSQFNVGDTIELGIGLHAGNINNTVMGQVFVDINGVLKAFLTPDLKFSPELVFIGPFTVQDLSPITIIRIPVPPEFPGFVLNWGARLFAAGIIPVSENTTSFTIGQGNISGKITTAPQEDDLRGYKVRIFSPEGELLGETETNEEGLFTVQNTPFNLKANYVITAEKGNIVLQGIVPTFFLSVPDEELNLPLVKLDAASTVITKLVEGAIEDVLGTGVALGTPQADKRAADVANVDVPEADYTVDVPSLMDSLKGALEVPDSLVSKLKDAAQDELNKLATGTTAESTAFPPAPERGLDAMAARISRGTLPDLLSRRVEFSPARRVGSALRKAFAAKLRASFDESAIKESVEKIAEEIRKAATRARNEGEAKDLDRVTDALVLALRLLENSRALGKEENINFAIARINDVLGTTEKVTGSIQTHEPEVRKTFIDYLGNTLLPSMEDANRRTKEGLTPPPPPPPLPVPVTTTTTTTTITTTTTTTTTIIVTGVASATTTPPTTTTPILEELSLSVSPSSGRVVQGDQVSYQVAVASTSPQALLVALSTAGLPAGIYICFYSTAVGPRAHRNPHPRSAS